MNQQNVITDEQLPTCSVCLLPIHPNETELRYFGWSIGHSASRCIQLLRMEIDRLNAELQRRAAESENAVLVEQLKRNEAYHHRTCPAFVCSSRVGPGDCLCGADKINHLMKAAATALSQVPQEKCEKCDGEGWIDRHDQPLNTSEKCPACHGIGEGKV